MQQKIQVDKISNRNLHWGFGISLTVQPYVGILKWFQSLYSTYILTKTLKLSAKTTDKTKTIHI